MEDVCAACGAVAAPLRCARCKAACYCDRKCQVAHWREGHKRACPQLRRRAAAVRVQRLARGWLVRRWSASVAFERELRAEIAAAAVKDEPEHPCPLCMEREDDEHGATWCMACGKAMGCSRCKEHLITRTKNAFLAGAAREHGALRCPHCRASFCGDHRVDVARIRKLLRERPEGRHVPQAWARLGDAYLFGNGVKSSPSEAFQWHLKAARGGGVSAQHQVGKLYETGTGVAEDNAEAVRWFRKAAKEGHPLALNSLAHCYSTGHMRMEPGAHLQAFPLFVEAAKRGHAGAMYMTGRCYRFGRGTTEDRQKAFTYFKLGAEQGDALAEAALGGAYFIGDGTARDVIKANEWLLTAAARKDPRLDTEVFHHGRKMALRDAMVALKKQQQKSNT